MNGISPSSIDNNNTCFITKNFSQSKKASPHIYCDKHGNEPRFIPWAPKIGGTAIGAIFVKGFLTSLWMGKIGSPNGEFKNDPSSLRTREIKEINFDSMREKIAYDLYRELGKGLFIVPNSYLSEQEISNQFTLNNQLMQEIQHNGITKCLWIMSKFLNSYQDFANIETKIDGQQQKISFLDYIRNYHRPPEQIYAPNGKLVPLIGLMSMFAVGRALADTDVLGGRGGNAGVQWKYDLSEATTVKIDPGFAFQFEANGINRVINTNKKVGHPKTHLNDLRDLQIANNDHSLTISWENLTFLQQKEFKETLFKYAQYVENPTFLPYMIYREGAFNRREKEEMPKDKADEINKNLRNWLNYQLKLYELDSDLEALKKFKKDCSGIVEAFDHLDKNGLVTEQDWEAWCEDAKMILSHPFAENLGLEIKEKIHERLGDIFCKFHKYFEALSEYGKATNFKKQISGKEIPSDTYIILLFFKIEACFRITGDFNRAMNCLELAIKLAEKNMVDRIFRAILRLVGNEMHRQGDILYRQDRYQEARKYYEKALESRKRFLPENHADIASTLREIGLCLHYQKRFDEAKKSYEDALNINLKLLLENPNDITAVLLSLGEYSVKDNYDKAIKNLEQSLKNQHQVCSQGHIEVISNLLGIGECLYELENYEEAMKIYGQALKVGQTFLGNNHPNIALCLNGLGACLHVKSEHARAKKLFQQAYNIAKEKLGENHSISKVCSDNLQNLMNQQNKCTIS